MGKTKKLHKKNDRIKEQLHALEVSKLFSKKDKLQIGGFYRSRLKKNTLKINRILKNLDVTISS